MTRRQAAQLLLECVRTLIPSGCFPAADGNLSVRLTGDRILITKAGVAKAKLRASDLVTQNLRGERRRETSTEWPMHRAIYAARPEICCVLHVHAPFLTAFAAAHRVPNRRLLVEAQIAIGDIVLVPYEVPGSEQLGRSLLKSGKSASIYLLANHGAVVVGKTVQDAQYVLERSEFLARTEIFSEALGGGRLLEAHNSTNEMASSVRRVVKNRGRTRA